MCCIEKIYQDKPLGPRWFSSLRHHEIKLPRYFSLLSSRETIIVDDVSANESIDTFLFERSSSVEAGLNAGRCTRICR